MAKGQKTINRPPDHLIPINAHVRANEAGLRWLEHFQAHRDPHAAQRCALGPGWICPFAAEGNGFPCLSRQKPLLVQIGYQNWTEHYEPLLQLSLFAPSVTHRRVRRHYRTQVELPPDSPPQHVSIFCRRMALAFIHWLETREGWHVPQWRIRPLGHATSHYRQWANQQIRQHKLKPCIFEPDL